MKNGEIHPVNFISTNELKEWKILQTSHLAIPERNFFKFLPTIIQSVQLLKFKSVAQTSG